MRLPVLLLALSLTTLTSGAVSAQPAQKPSGKLSAQEASKKFAEADQHYKLQEFDKALEGFKELYRLTNEPTLLFNIAQCDRQMGHLEEALRQYKLFIQEDPSSELKSNAQSRITELETAIQQQQADADAKAKADQEAAQAALHQEAPKKSKPLYIGGGAALVFSGSLGGAALLVTKSQAALLAKPPSSQAEVNDFNQKGTNAKILAAASDLCLGIALTSIGVGIWRHVHQEPSVVILSPTGATLAVRW